MSRYTRTVDLGALGTPQAVTLDQFPTYRVTGLQITKVPDAGDLWVSLVAGRDAVDGAHDTQLIDSGSPYATFNLDRFWHPVDGSDFTFSVLYPTGGRLLIEVD